MKEFFRYGTLLMIGDPETDLITQRVTVRFRGVKVGAHCDSPTLEDVAPGATRVLSVTSEQTSNLMRDGKVRWTLIGEIVFERQAS